MTLRSMEDSTEQLILHMISVILPTPGGIGYRLEHAGLLITIEYICAVKPNH